MKTGLCRTPGTDKRGIFYENESILKIRRLALLVKHLNKKAKHISKLLMMVRIKPCNVILQTGYQLSHNESALKLDW